MSGYGDEECPPSSLLGRPVQISACCKGGGDCSKQWLACLWRVDMFTADSMVFGVRWRLQETSPLDDWQAAAAVAVASLRSAILTRLHVLRRPVPDWAVLQGLADQAHRDGAYPRALAYYVQVPTVNLPGSFDGPAWTSDTFLGWTLTVCYRRCVCTARLWNGVQGSMSSCWSPVSFTRCVTAWLHWGVRFLRPRSCSAWFPAITQAQSSCCKGVRSVSSLRHVTWSFLTASGRCRFSRCSCTWRRAMISLGPYRQSCVHRCNGRSLGENRT